ncbi:MAG: NAD/NADP octopine/nopaline dehydrogenase family protein [Limnochordia bacterium]|jgi:opine dehydrogenase
MDIAILGAGAAGQAIAAMLSWAGHSIALYNRTAARLDEIAAKGGIEVTKGPQTGLMRIQTLTSSVGTAVSQAEVIIIATQAKAHSSLAKELVPYVKDGQIILLIPGSGGSLEVSRIFREMKVTCDMIVGETSIVPFPARLRAPATVAIRVPAHPRIAALPATDNEALFRQILRLFPVKPVAHVLEVALHNPNMIIHPGPFLLNYGEIERSQGHFSLMNEGMTEGVLSFMDELDRERMNVCRELGFKPISIDNIYREFGSGPEVYREPGEPTGFRDSVHYRFIDEDVPFALMLLSSVGRILGTPTPLTDAIISIASVLRKTDFRANGRGSESLGIQGLTKEELLCRLEFGNDS